MEYFFVSVERFGALIIIEQSISAKNKDISLSLTIDTMRSIIILERLKLEFKRRTKRIDDFPL